MINSIKINALKCINEIEINCSNFNLIVGTNSSGKSTALQAILLLAQNISEKSGLNGSLVSLGDFREVRNFNIPLSQICIEIKGVDSVRLIIDENRTNIITDKDKEKLKYELDVKSGKIHYLSCQRIGHQDIYFKNLSNQDTIGYDGKYAMYYLMKHAKDNLEECLIKNTDQETLDYQVNYWLKYIVNATVSTEDVFGTDILKAFYTIVDGKLSRPKNVGSGIGYIVSVIVMCLSAKKGDILIIENPEIHLHPLSQSRVCEFLYFVSKSGRQLFVETHSDHIFNGIRAGIATNKINEKEISVNFFSLDKNNCTNNMKVQFGKRGKIINPGKDLFDQFDVDLNKMLGL